jgi:hypothetical protein
VRADREAVVAALHDLPDDAGPHHLADADRRDVGAGVVHPAAHGRVERDVLGAEQELALAGLGDRLGGHLPRAVVGEAGGTGGQAHLGVVGHRTSLPPGSRGGSGGPTGVKAA